MDLKDKVLLAVTEVISMANRLELIDPPAPLNYCLMATEPMSTDYSSSHEIKSCRLFSGKIGI